MNKQCNRCLETKPIEQFSLNKPMKDGRLNQCNVCKCEYVKAHSKTERGKSLKRATMKRWKENNRHKVFAHTCIRNGVAAGKIERMPCEVCGVAKSEAHHDDYGKPYDVRWLCKLHHNELHKHSQAKQ